MMGFLDFFRKKEEEKTVVLDFEDVPHWLDEFLQKKNLEERFDHLKADLEDKLEELEARIRELEDADLMNPNIPDKHKQIMRGNRERYVNRMRRFVKDFEFPDDYKEMGFFASKLSEDIVDLGADTSKNFQVLKQFFEEEAKKIASKVNEIEQRVIDFRQKLDEEDLGLVSDIKVLLKDLDQEVRARKELKVNKKDLEGRLEELKEKEERIKKKINKLKASENYEKFKDLHEEKTSARERIEEIRKDLSRKFSSLERALKKYSHNSPDERFVQDYIDAPEMALERDDELKIVKILEELEESIPTLGLKDRKQDNTLSVIDELSEDTLKKLKEELEMKKEEVSHLTQQLKDNVTSMNITEQEEFLKNVRRKMDDVRDEIGKIDNDLERINPELTRQKIRKKVKGLADVKFQDELKEEE